MASRTRLQLRTLVRTQLDMDIDELPDLTLDTWFEDGLERSLAIEDRWPFFEYEWNFTTLDSTVGYTKASLQAADVSTYAIEQIVDVMDITTSVSTFELKAISNDVARKRFGLGGVGGGVPAYWSEWAGKLNVWPSPYAGRSLRVYGYRKPLWAAGDTVAPDCDERLHLCLYFFGCAMAYDQQEDEALSAEYMKHWTAALQQAHKKIMAAPQRRPVVLSGGMGCVWR